MRKISQYLSQWPVALFATLALAALVLLPGLGEPGLWEPTERQLSDRVTPPDPVQAELDAHQAKVKQQTAALPAHEKPPEPACRKAPPPDAIARSLQHRAMKAGRDYIADDDSGRRLPFALLGLLTVLATAGIAMRIARARAGVVTAIILLSMPLLVLQSRMLTTDIGTACGASLIVFGLVALQRRQGDRFSWLALALVGALALAAGIVIGFVAGGALLGLLVPIGAVAAANQLGLRFVADVGRGAYNATLWLARRVHPRWAIGRSPRAYTGRGHAPAFLATLAALALIGALAYQLYDLRPPHPGIHPPARRVGDFAVVPEGCWSWLLGGVWRAEDDLRFVFDSTWEQIAYGMFPWGVLGPVAMLLLLRDADPRRRFIGALTLAWAGGAWIAAEAFQRKVGVTIWAGFPAVAIAIGTWIDGVLERRSRGDSGMPAGAMLIALFVLLGVLDLGKDLVAFPERLTSLLTGTETIQYPADARIVGLKVKHWVLAAGEATVLGMGLALVLWRAGESRAAAAMRSIALWCAIASIAATVALAAFWPFAWHPRLSDHLSSKAMFETYRSLRDRGDQLVIMGDLGQAPYFYADNPQYEKAPSREQVVTALKRTNRVFAIAPQTELCHLHREMGAQPYFVIDDRNTRNLLFSNQLDGATNKNALLEMMTRVPPTNITSKPKGRVVWDNRIELIGWDIPKRVRRGAPLEITVYYKILQPVGGNWTVLMHIDGGARIGGDHKPIKDRCPTATWQAGDYIIDRHTVVAGGAGHPFGPYSVWIGFFTGTAPNFKNMDLTLAPDDMRDKDHRVKITSVIID